MAQPNYVKATNYFLEKQREHGYIEKGNVVQAKWDMRAVLEQIDDDKMVKKLIQYFLLLSDDKSFKEFFNKYNDYYESMLQTIEDRAKRRYLREQTVKGKIG